MQLKCSRWLRGWAMSVFQWVSRSAAPAVWWARPSSRCLWLSLFTCCRRSFPGCRTCSSSAPAAPLVVYTPRHPRRHAAVTVHLVHLVVVFVFVVILLNIVIVVARSLQRLLWQDYLSAATLKLSFFPSRKQLQTRVYIIMHHLWHSIKSL